MNPIMMTDAYKATHWQQYPRQTRSIYSYFESRATNENIVFAGLSYLLQHHFEEQLEQLSRYHVYAAKRHLTRVHGVSYFNENSWLKLLRKPLPLRIKAVREGAIVPSGNVLLTVENTDPEFYWLTNYVETLLCQLWYPCTVATISNQLRRRILESLKRTGTETLIDSRLHDFGARACSTMEQAALGGFAHLISFGGTDNLPAVDFVERYYQGTAGASIPASEHSTMTSWGRAHESEAYENMLDVYNSPVSIVSDSWDIFNACKNIFGGEFKQRIQERKQPVIIRPDSGDPVEVTLKVIEILGEQFGHTINSKGYKVLPDCVRILQGDGVSRETIDKILSNYETHKWSADNIAFGMGGNLLQNCNRDTFSFAFKCSSMNDGADHDVFKEPVTDSKKKSKRGKLKLLCADGKYATVPETQNGKDELICYYDNGIVHLERFDEIRQRARKCNG